LAVDAAGTIYVASQQRILAFANQQLEHAEEVARFDGPVSCLAWHASTGLLAGVTDSGLVRINADGHLVPLEMRGMDLRHPSGVAVAPDGAVLVTEGSAHHGSEAWVKDLMERGASGRLLRLAPGSSRAELIADHLAFPTGVTHSPIDGGVLVAEAWGHRLLRFSATGERSTVLDDLPGYPYRLVPCDEGAWWLSLFAPRTHLVEFVLAEEGFRRQMMATINADYWIAPSMESGEHHLRPVQIGGLRSQNLKKPWAPSSSYGLVAKVDRDFQVLESYHSRANGSRHGTSGLARVNGRLLVAATGANCLLLPEQQAASPS
jgi:hypothetical protein